MRVLEKIKANTLVIFMLILGHSLYASHTLGGSVTYRCIDTTLGRYEITVNLFRDCSGVSYGSESLQVISTRYTGMINMGQPKVREITPICRVPDVAVQPTTNCPSGPIGSIKGTEVWTYKANVILGKNLGWAIVGWGSCCRTGMLSTILSPGGQGIWIQAAINTNMTNSSPVFNSDATSYSCFNRENWLDFSAKDTLDSRYMVIDGNYIERDSLVYELYTPFTGLSPNSNNAINLLNPAVTYIAPYSANNFFRTSSSMNFNKNTGIMRFTPTVMGESVTGIVVKEYRAIPSANGKSYTRQLAGYITRDQNFSMTVCEAMQNDGVIADSSNVEKVVHPNLVQTCRAKGNKIMMRFSMGTGSSSLKIKDVSVINHAEISNYSFKSTVTQTGSTYTGFAEFLFDRNFATKGYEFKVKVYYCNPLGISIESYIPLSVQFNSGSIRFETDTLQYCHNSGAVTLSLPLAKKVNWKSNDAIVHSDNQDSNMVIILPLNSHWIYANNLKTSEMCRVNDSVYVKVETCNKVSGNVVYDINNNCNNEENVDIPAKVQINLKGLTSNFNQTIYPDNLGNFTFTPPTFNDYTLTVNKVSVNCNEKKNTYHIQLKDTQISLKIPIKDSASFMVNVPSAKNIYKCFDEASIDFNVPLKKSLGFIKAKLDYGNGIVEDLPIGTEEMETVLKKSHTYVRSGIFIPILKIFNYSDSVLFQTSLDTVRVHSCVQARLFIDMDNNCSYEANGDILRINSPLALKDFSSNELNTKSTNNLGVTRFYVNNGGSYNIKSIDILNCNQDKDNLEFTVPNQDTIFTLNLPIDRTKVSPNVDIEYNIVSSNQQHCINSERLFLVKIHKTIGDLNMHLKYNDGADTIVILPFREGIYTYSFNHIFMNKLEGSVTADFLFNGKIIKQIVSPKFKQVYCITATVYADKNRNCHDDNEPKLKSLHFKLTNLSTNISGIVFSNSAGLLNLKLEKGVNYRLTCDKFKMCKESNSMILRIDSDSIEALKIPVQYHCNYKPSVDLPRVDFNNTTDYVLGLKVLEDYNNFIDSISDSTYNYELTLPINCYFKGINENMGVKLTYLESNKFEIRTPSNVIPQITVYFRNIKESDIFCFFVKLNRVNKELDTSDNKDNRCRRALASYDPNNKISLIRSSISEEDFIDKTNPIHYTINFQNEGKAPARDVYILDQLSERLNWESMEIRQASHPMSVSMSDNGLVRFDFKEIILVEKSKNEEASKGFVRFTIYPKGDLQIGEEIRNTAAIYFDLNEPIITNTAISRLVKPIGEYGFYDITTDVYPPNTGTAEGQGRYLFYDPIRIQAIPKPGYSFQYWVENGVVQAAKAEHFSTATKNKRYTAYFTKSTASVINADFKVSISPNPATDKIFIEVPSHIKYYSVRIFTMEGRLIQAYAQPASISVTALPRGLYFMELQTEEGITKMEKLELR